ncbi:MAG: hypothetical protein IJL11_03315, partial [Synergistaceae bacterium]|nr:hypothetical protein [Synergistaceae bacterium]
ELLNNPKVRAAYLGG